MFVNIIPNIYLELSSKESLRALWGWGGFSREKNHKRRSESDAKDLNHFCQIKGQEGKNRLIIKNKLLSEPVAILYKTLLIDTIWEEKKSINLYRLVFYSSRWNVIKLNIKASNKRWAFQFYVRYIKFRKISGGGDDSGGCAQKWLKTLYS